MAGFRSAGAFDGLQRRSQAAAKFEFLSLAIGVVRHQQQLVQPFLELCGCLRHC
jgi:hypothetical protein